MFEFKPLKKPVQQNKPPGKVASAFSRAMDDDDEAPSKATKPKISSFAASIPQTNYQKILDETSKIVLEDPSVYSYDEHYDEIKEKRQELEQTKKQQQVGSKYIANLKAASEKRKVEQSIVYEKIAEKELKRDDANSTGEKYVTASYKRMMEENKKFAEEDAAKEAYNQQHAASLEENTSGMYKDLYKQDIFMGGYRPDIATMMKQPQKPAAATPQPQPEQKKLEEAAAPQQKPQPQPERRAPEEERRQPEQRAQASEREEGKRDREESREREKSPSGLEKRREERKEEEEKKAEKEPEKELTKEEKLKLMKERYMQRKLNQSAAPGPGPENA